MALNPKLHVTLTIEELEDIKNAAMERAEEMEWQLRVELQKIREIERTLSRILGETSQVPAAAATAPLGRGTPLHGTPTPPAELKKPIIAAVPAAPAAPIVPKVLAAPIVPKVLAAPAVTPPPPTTHVGPPPAPPAVPAPIAATAAKTVPTVRPSWSPPPPPPSTARRTAPPPLPANVHRLNPPRKA